jgi:hypothetical protein
MPFSPPASAYALLHSRSSFWRSRLLWIDAVCIKQNNTDEKTHQLRLMRDIYERADRVIAWPGDNFDSSLASVMLYDLCATSLMYQGSPLDAYNWLFGDRHSPRWLALLKLFQNPYFTRVWIVQEVAVGSNVQLCHGGVYVAWEVVMRIMDDCWHPHRRSLVEYTSDPGMRILDPSQYDSVNNAAVMQLVRTRHRGREDASFLDILQPRLVRTRHQSGENATPLDIGQLLSLCYKFEASEPKDRVFALHGLASTGMLPMDVLDYSKTTTITQVYAETARCVLSQGIDPLVILPYVGVGFRDDKSIKDVPDLPSWAADWSCKRIEQALASSTYTTAAYCTAAHLQAVVQVSLDQRTVSLKGVLVDTIDKLTAPWKFSPVSGDRSSTLNHFKAQFSWYQQAKSLALRHAREPYPKAGQSRYEAFWRTIIGDRSQDMRPVPPDFANYHRLWERLLGIFHLARDHAAIDGSFQDPYSVLDQIDTHSKAGMREYGIAFGESSYGRRFCVSRNGLIGLVPPQSKTGDLVFIIFGASTPYLLRPSGPLYQLVGECYMHGMMDKVGKRDAEFGAVWKEEMLTLA